MPSNPPAFPIHPHSATVPTFAEHHLGMTLRDWFAGMVAPAIFAHHCNAGYVAKVAYEIADAMLRQRQQTRKP